MMSNAKVKAEVKTKVKVKVKVKVKADKFTNLNSSNNKNGHFYRHGGINICVLRDYRQGVIKICGEK
jgi:hypothetical protein